jgi:23S rRNA pseudouridine2605 synthase
MTAKRKSVPASPAAKRVSKTAITKTKSKAASVKAGKAPAKAKAPVAKTLTLKTKPVGAVAPKRVAKAKTKVGTRAGAPAAKTKKARAKAEETAGYRIGHPVVDPIGDVSSGEARTYLGDAEPSLAHAEMEAFVAETETAASDAILEAGPGMEAAQEKKEARARKKAEDAAARDAEDDGAATASEVRTAGKLERLQKILSQAGIASRRRAEEMIVEGRVMVNGQVVTTLGSKADAAHDHIRVDGKLLQGAERHRYFMLNKPKGYVTTVSDPEGRQTVMEFFAKAGERLYPVGRLDYQSEGLLLMTNDGELANLLTKAGSGVEKTYLVKVAGQPNEEELERLRNGVTIERGEPGSEHVRTAPARVRQVREGDNPWYEVVLTEGRNRELRKMFSAVGHFVEKIRRVGYGPLVLDLEPGKVRELTLDEVNKLRLTAEGRMKPRRVKTPSMLPKDAGRAAEERSGNAAGRGGRSAHGTGTAEFGNAAGKRGFVSGSKRGFGPPRGGRASGNAERFRGQSRPDFGAQRSDRPTPGAKPRFERPGERPRFDRPRTERTFSDAKPRIERPGGRLSFTEVKPGSEPPQTTRPYSGGKPRFERPSGERKFSGAKPRFDRSGFAGRTPREGVPGKPGPFGERPGQRSGGQRPFSERRPFSDAKPRFERPGFAGKPKFDRPGVAGGPREQIQSGAGERPRRPFGAPGGRPPFKRFGESKERFERAPGKSFGARPGKPWTERPNAGTRGEGGQSGPASGTRFEPRRFEAGGFRKPGGFSKPGGKSAPYRGKPGGAKRGGAYRPGGRPGGGKRG